MNLFGQRRVTLIGIALIVMAIIAFVALEQPFVPFDPQDPTSWRPFVVPGLLFVIGLVITVLGAAGVIDNVTEADPERQKILEEGEEIEATVKGVQANPATLTNTQSGDDVARYSIVTYAFVDKAGKTYGGRDPLYPTSQVSRHNLERGSTVQVRYLPDDPTKSVIVGAG